MVRNLLAVLTVAVTSPAFATLAYTTPGSTTSQNFDTLTTATTAQAWTNDGTLDGWYLFNGAGSVPPTYLGDDGSSTTGSFKSYGTTGNSDRALGGLGSSGAYFGSPGSGFVAGYIAFGFNNATGQTLDTFTVKYDGEQWRNGGNSSQAQQTMRFQYGIGADFASVPSWTTPGGFFNFVSPVVSPTAAAVDGNNAGLVTNRGGVIKIPTGLAAGQTLWLRWVETNDAGNDHALAIDNFTISAIPEPTAALFGSLLAGAFGLSVARRPASRD